MKKLLSSVLAIIMMLLAFAIFPATADAAVNKPKETTYIASQNVYQNSYGKVYVYRNKLISETAQGKRTVLATPSDKSSFSTAYSFYMRGKTVIYKAYDPELYPEFPICSINIDGTNKTEIVTTSADLLGGYGNTILLRGGKAVVNNKITKLYNFNYGYYETLFSGNIYYANRVYNLDTGKISVFEKRNSTIGIRGTDRKSKSPVVTNKYMYYLNKSNSLVRMDTNGNQSMLAKNVDEILSGNSFKNVVYTKKNSKGIKTIYRQDSNKRNYTLASFNDIKKMVNVNDPYLKPRPEVTGAVFVGKKVYFIAHNKDISAILSVNNTGGNLKTVKKETRDFTMLCTIESCGDTIYYMDGYFGAFTSYNNRIIKTV